MVVGLVITLKSGSILAVQTASMKPVFVPGDAVIITQKPRSFQIGEIVTYHSHQDLRQFVSHRVVAADMPTQKLITKGDNLPEADPAIRTWDVIGKVICIIPRAGYVLNFLYTWPGLICAIYLPALIILILEVRRVVR